MCRPRRGSGHRERAAGVGTHPTPQAGRRGPRVRSRVELLGRRGVDGSGMAAEDEHPAVGQTGGPVAITVAAIAATAVNAFVAGS